MANSVDVDSPAVWAGPTLFAQICLSESLGSLRYLISTGTDKHLSNVVSKCFQPRLKIDLT